MSAGPHLMYRLARWLDRITLRARVQQLQSLISQIETEVEISHDNLAVLRTQLATARELLSRAEHHHPQRRAACR